MEPKANFIYDKAHFICTEYILSLFGVPTRLIYFLNLAKIHFLRFEISPLGAKCPLFENHLSRSRSDYMLIAEE